MSLLSYVEYLLFPQIHLDTERLSRALRGKTVLITGASYGIGEALVYRLKDSGAHLILVARSEEKLSLIGQQLADNGTSYSLFVVDLTNEEQMEAFINALLVLPQGIDVVVSNAGKSIRRSIFAAQDRYHDFTRTMQLNYFAPVRLLLALLPILQRQKGHIIQVSALNVHLLPMPHWAAYQAAKTAFDQWFRCVQPELIAAGVSMTSIYLPLVRTRMIEPTLQYRNLPAMSADYAATTIARTCYTYARSYSPYWFGFVRGLSAVFGRLGEYLLSFPWVLRRLVR